MLVTLFTKLHALPNMVDLLQHEPIVHGLHNDIQGVESAMVALHPNSETTV